MTRQAITCRCPICASEGQHHVYCSVHHADYESMAVPPCDCGRRDGNPREPANAIVHVHCERLDDDEPPN